MEKTTHYQLNKPEATDPMRVGDFNENADIIDAAIKAVEQSVGAAWSANNTPWEMGTLTLMAVSEGTVVKTFDFIPSAVFIFAQTMLGGMATNGNVARVTRPSDTTSYCLLKLTDNTLTLTDSSGGSLGTLQYVALK